MAAPDSPDRVPACRCRYGRRVLRRAQESLLVALALSALLAGFAIAPAATAVALPAIVAAAAWHVIRPELHRKTFATVQILFAERESTDRLRVDCVLRTTSGGPGVPVTVWLDPTDARRPSVAAVLARWAEEARVVRLAVSGPHRPDRAVLDDGDALVRVEAPQLV